jgi:hypothetical protein
MSGSIGIPAALFRVVLNACLANSRIGRATSRTPAPTQGKFIMSKLHSRSLIVAASLLLAMGGGQALAMSNAETQCLASGGIYEKNGPVATCVYEEETNNPNENANDNAQKTVTVTESGKGNLKKSETECDGPPGQCNKVTQ